MPEYGLNIGSRRSVNVITPTFDRDFVTYGTLNHGTGPNITFTRASSATVFTSTGVLSTVPDNVPRFEWGSFRTNYIRNSTMAGAVVGVIGAGGAWPSSGWNNSGSVPGVSAEIVGTGTISGLNYIDIKFSGTNTGSTANLVVRFDATTQVVATSGQTWTGSVYLALVGGDFSGLTTPIAQLVERNSLGNLIDSSSTSISNINATLQRITVTRQFNQTTTAYGNFQVVPGTCNAGSSVNITLRFAAPQYELSSAATAFIPTTTSAVTTGVPLGLLIEESRTNFVGEQNLFSWSQAGIPTLSAGSGIAGLSSFIVNDLRDDYFSQIWYTFPTALLSSTTYVFSCYIRKNLNYNNTYPLLRVYSPDNNIPYAGINFNQATGQAAIQPGYTLTSAVSVQDYNTYYRASFTFNTQSTAVPTQVEIIPSHGYGFGPTLSGTSIEVAGIQVEQGSFPTSYIPTAGLSATRAADIALTNDLSFYNQDQGTLYTEILKVNNPSDAKWASFTLSTNTTQNITIQNYAERHEFVVWNSTARSIAFNNNIINSNYKLAGAYQNSNFQATQNGVLSNPILNFIPSKNINRFSLGSLNGSQFYLNNYLRKVTYWPTRLSNNRLRTLTLSA